MENTINFGIDLGTTNSAIAKFVQGEVVVFNNPLDYGRATLPSVVMYRKDKVVVGSKAKEFLERDPKSVVGAFKRRMGTSMSFKINAINESKTPIELSAEVLKELKTFVTTGENVDAAVITVPASFDLIQSNATKEAGSAAGFRQVILLQEPIAASLAYANMKKARALTDGQWLVYDLGGGTFDVALIRIKDGEMRVIDHEGDNFLGGADFDQLIVEKLLIPRISKSYRFTNLEKEMKSESGKFNAKYFVLLRRAEEAKIRLSAAATADIVVDGMEDEKGKMVDEEITITRAEFNSLIQPSVDATLEMIRAILTRNNVSPIDLQFTLMVGGSTYIPYVRQRVEDDLQVPVNVEIDPTTAVAIGAAYYAATKMKEVRESRINLEKKKPLSIKASYSKASKEREELFAARVMGDVEGLSYKIVRQDGGFDSGMKKLTERISEDLPLVENAYNLFILTVYDAQNNVVPTDLEPIGINSGYGISGQPLPEDICLEVDDYDNPGNTRLALVFPRNTILPTKRTLTFPLNKSIVHGSTEDVLHINVLLGSHLALPEANKSIGYINIAGKDLQRDISRGSDLEITLSISESQDLSVAAYLSMADQEFKQTFNPKERHTPIELLKQQVRELAKKLEAELRDATVKEDLETSAILTRLNEEMKTVVAETERLTHDDVTDKRYQLEDKKRKLAQEIDNATKHKRIQLAKEEYYETKKRCQELLTSSGNPHEQRAFQDIVAQEEVFMASNVVAKIQEKSDELAGISQQIEWRTPEYLMGVFNWLSSQQRRMTDQGQAGSLIESGKSAIHGKNWDRLRSVNYELFALMPKGAREEVNTRIGFGM
jgi:molecular chaperone DnaK